MSKEITSKQQIRREIETQRKALDAQWLETASARVVETLLSMDVFQSAETVALYMAISGEVNLDSLFQKCRELGKRTCIPVFNTKEKLYEMAEITPETECLTGHYGIREPLSPCLFPMDNVDLVVVPGVAFDRKGNRLGRGGGYYDRLLEGFSGASSAVAFDFQVLPSIPLEQHDKPVDVLVTETEIMNVLQ
ncbi:MAG: 5-formyltetrahydrofolate cyclo-ligase [Verrucomicrobia bacterium]|nr:5-formyltetrahydrofolate cyclo-ligase [Verrucomicrobiota bacterium]